MKNNIFLIPLLLLSIQLRADVLAEVILIKPSDVSLSKDQLVQLIYKKRIIIDAANNTLGLVYLADDQVKDYLKEEVSVENSILFNYLTEKFNQIKTISNLDLQEAREEIAEVSNQYLTEYQSIIKACRLSVEGI
ncbi:hypothetical protein HYX58_03495 [Candidatus Dependentiae bacterium]|nr:hypothetical protein [Candidatus Dependentiae bacterium]